MQFSVIIPTYNRGPALALALDSLKEVDFPATDFEVLVVDNGSTDRTREVFDQRKPDSAGSNWRYLNEPMPGLLSGRHKGALESRGEVCVFIDDDVRVRKGWLRALDEAFSDPSVVLTGGPSDPLCETDPPDWFGEFRSDGPEGTSWSVFSLFDGGDAVREIDPCYVWGLNYAIRRESLFEAGGFHPDCIPRSLQRYQGDGETGLSLKLLKLKARCLYHPGARVLHEIPRSRFTPEYIETRGYYQGVCDSYSVIREDGSVRPGATRMRAAKHAVRSLWLDTRESAFGTPPTIRQRARRAWERGYLFHQREVASDPSLLEWVLRKDYWEYRLPDGWERHRDAPAAEKER